MKDEERPVSHLNHYKNFVECVDLVPLHSRCGPISFRVNSGEWICISGPSGVGKSSLLFVLAGLQHPVSGTIRCMGLNPEQLGLVSRRRFRRHSVYLAPQTLPLCSQLDAFHNVLFPQRIGGGGSSAACHNMALKLGLQNRLNFFPWQLSVGEIQRVCIARGLAADVPLLLIDEPTSNLDDTIVSILVGLFENATDAGRSLIVVSNDTRLTPLADRIIHLNFADPDS